MLSSCFTVSNFRTNIFPISSSLCCSNFSVVKHNLLTHLEVRTTNKFMNGNLWKCTTIADEPTSSLNNSQASRNLVVLFDSTRKAKILLTCCKETKYI